MRFDAPRPYEPEEPRIPQAPPRPPLPSDRDLSGMGEFARSIEVVHPQRPGEDGASALPPPPWAGARLDNLSPRRPAALQPPVLPIEGPISWPEGEITITILGDPAASADLPRACAFGTVRSIGSAEFQEACCVVIGDDARLEYQAVREVGTMQIDGDSMRRDLGLISSWTLDRLIHSPNSIFLNVIFRMTLWGAATPPSIQQDFTTRPGETFHVTVDDYPQFAVGDQTEAHVVDERHDDLAQISLARLLARDSTLVRQFATLLGGSADPTARQEFQAQATRALSSLTDAELTGCLAVDNELTVDGFVRQAGGTLTTKGITAAMIGVDPTVITDYEVNIDTVAVSGDWVEQDDPRETFTLCGVTFYDLFEMRKRRAGGKGNG